MKWLISTLFLVALYTFSIIFLIGNSRFEVASVIFLVIMCLVNFFRNIIAMIKNSGQTQEVNNQMRKIMLYVKLLSIPFFVVNFFVWLGMFGIIAVVPQGIPLLLFVPLVVFATFLILLVTSSYSISTIVLYRKSNKLTIKELIIHIILQLIFVIDIIDSIFLFRILRKRDMNTTI